MATPVVIRRTVDVTMLVVMALLLMGAGSERESGVTLTDVVGFLREFGFPVFVSLWFMWRLEKRLEALFDAINKLLTIVTVMSRTNDEQSTGRQRRQGASVSSGKDVA